MTQKTPIASVLVCFVVMTAWGASAEVPAPSTQPAPTTTASGDLLWPGRAPGAIGDADADRPTLTAYLPPADKFTGIAMVVAPGGGYSHLSMIKEGSDVARWLNEHGIAAFVLKYRLAPYRHPVPLEDARRAVRTVRSKSDQYKIDPKRIGMIGFSAGGHLTSTLGTHFDDGDPGATDPIERLSCRPDFMVLLYPVISMEIPTAHKGSLDNLLGPNPDPALQAELSNQKQVNSKTPPTFIVHSIPDKTVPVENSRIFYDALQKNGVPSELVIFDTGGHGYGLAPNDAKLRTWTDKCLAWMKAQKIIR